MRTCLGLLLLLLVLGAIVFTVIYHASINADVRFERKETNTEFINTRRSFRPPAGAAVPHAVIRAATGYGSCL